MNGEPRTRRDHHVSEETGLPVGPMTPTRPSDPAVNEAAERLRGHVANGAVAQEDVDAALATERRNTVERISGEALYRAYWQAAWAAMDYRPQWEQLSTPTRAVWNDAANRIIDEIAS